MQDIEGNTLLHFLVTEKKEESIAQLFSFDSIKLYINNEQKTPFHNAIEGNNPNIISMFLQKFGKSLVEMKFPGNLDILQYMLRINSFTSFQHIFSIIFPGDNPLFYAATHGSIELLQFLVNPVDIRIKNVQGKNLLKICLENGHLDCAIYLLSIGSEFDFSDIAFLCTKVPIQRIMFLKTKYDWTKVFEGRESFGMFALRKPFNPALFKFAVKCGINPDERDPATNISPLIKIIQESNTVALKILLENGFPPLYDGKQPLITVFARAKTSAMLMTLLSNGVSQTDVPGERTPLMMAAASRDSALLTYENNEDIAFRDLVYLFDVPIFERNFGAALVLLTQKPEITPKHVLQAVTSWDLPALFFYLICSKFTSSQVSEIHMKSPAKNQVCSQMIDFFLQDDSNKTSNVKFNSLTFGNTGLLHIAAKYATKEIFERLVRKGFDIDQEDSQGYRPLDYALESCRFDNISVLTKSCVCCNSNSADFPTILHKMCKNKRLKYYLNNATDEEKSYVSQFIEYAIQEGQSLNEVDFDGLTPILIAILDGNLILCEILMKLGSSNDFLDNDISYLHLLLMNYINSIEDHFAQQMFLFRYTTTEPRPPTQKICQLCCDVFNYCPKYSSHDGDTILHICTKLNLPVLVEYILKKGDTLCKKDDKNNNGDTALHIAARMGNMQLAQVLVENGCELNVTNNLLQTPLICSLYSQNPMCAMYLINAGASYNIYDSNLMTPLHVACMNGHYYVALALLSENPPPPVNFADIYGRTPAYYAAKNGSTAFMIKLLSAKANIFQSDYKGRTPMHAACKYGNYEIVKYLIDSLPPNFSDDDRNCTIHLAAKHNHHQILQLFHNKKEAWNVKNAKGDTPMHVAVRRDNVICVQVLLQMGADPNLRNFEGETPFVLAAALKSHQCLSLFVQIGFKFLPENGFLALRHVLLAGDFEYANEICKSQISLNIPFWGRNLLTMAVAKNRLDIVKFLCSHKCMDTLDKMDLTPFAYSYVFDYREILDEMLKQYPGKRQSDILDMFSNDIQKRRDIARRSPPNEIKRMKMDLLSITNNKVPLMFKDKATNVKQLMMNAVQRNDLETLNVMLANYNINPNISFEGRTLLSVAVTDTMFDVTSLLLMAGADPNRRNKSNGDYPLLIACRTGKPTFVKLLLDNGARLDMLDKDEKTLLHIAAEESLHTFANVIIECGANVHALDNKGRTPLHIAVEKGFVQSVKQLMRAGARKDVKDADGRSPQDYAKVLNNSSVSQALDSP
ncbi:hypothetical protein TVAG_265920 [Trichomonas vaginalis G3]|uniref:Ankyrin repeat protein n=1 Tax=Trichomonas vaginalis (strain ATCC PRA-98 / G3) TaxID=412133 RepID=A2F2I9_TRIV3|nr:spectrin binding [Trichomonas vaginalis G3]EAY00889.1 hypothetical protein TVAG_265920 [Trichomonas vaginalis G3]KAI5489238.1 spectrin binding [Trichomonas vaginalis G3]|eukprot:XP_001313818.1 hypothetical protein [Trichomonas vaginalis G3]